jgi:uroporphyrin-III C-methyltransferase / precorrin-2 dehydrogenase / sirohydrochlorin ferrochelatase
VSSRFGFPVNLAVRGRRCVVVGGGPEAALRVRRLSAAGADLLVVTPEPGAELRASLPAGPELRARAWLPRDLDGAFLVIATREDPLDAPELYAAGRERGALVNVLDDVERCDFAAMSQVVHGDFQLSIATNGRAPALAKVARQWLEASFGPAWGELTEIVDEVKQELGPRGIPFAEWARRWAVALADVDDLLERLERGEREAVHRRLLAVVQGAEVVGHGIRGPGRAEEDPCPPGRVHLVGAGPGDPELLTLRAARLLGGADLVVHDQLVPRSILGFSRPTAELVAVGRRRGHVVLPHEEVIELLAAAASAGRRVVRLKGGDPVVFGRGGEEALDLAARGIASELVPGVTSAVAAPELAGIPLTHRGVARGFLVVTAEHASGVPGRSPWEVAAGFDGTVVVLMGAARLEELATELRRLGRAPETPAAVIERAGHPGQRVVTGTLSDLPARARAAGIGTPAVIVVGEVVALRTSGRGPDERDDQTRRTSTAACL